MKVSALVTFVLMPPGLHKINYYSPGREPASQQNHMGFGMNTISSSENCKNFKQEGACNIGIVNILTGIVVHVLVCTLRLYILLKSEHY